LGEASATSRQAPDVVVFPLGLVGMRRLWQALLADWNLALERMFDGNTDPFPEKLGLGRL
jgi:hypothetical protein